MVIKKSFDCGYDALCTMIDRGLSENKRVTVAIDGMCTSGKTTMALWLKNRYSCNVFHMDDFYYSKDRRTEERMAEIGGNIAYEYFKEAILRSIRRKGESFTYNIYDCKTGLCELMSVGNTDLTVIEGTYANLPCFNDPYDIKVFIRIPEELQEKRVKKERKERADAFFSTWIPREREYFKLFDIQNDFDLLIDIEEN